MKHKNNEIGSINALLILLILIACCAITFLLMGNNSSQESVIGNEKIVDESEQFRNSYGNIQKNDNGVGNVPKLSQEITNSSLDNNQYESQDVNNYEEYYYLQLNNYAKNLYNGVWDNKTTLIDGYGSIDFNINEPNVEQYFQTAWDAISLDKPELFYVDTTKLSLLTRSSTNFFGKVSYSYTLKPQEGENYYVNTWSNANEVKQAINQVNNQIDTILNNAPKSNKRYDLIKYVHDYLIENVEYNQDDDVNNGNIYGALINKKAVCEGYAKTFKILMDKLNVPCVTVFGKSKNDSGETEFHAWNYVMLENNKWYAIDTTWDDPIIIGRGTISDKTKHKYFLVGSDFLYLSHFEDGDVSGTGQSFKYPMLSNSDY